MGNFPSDFEDFLLTKHNPKGIRSKASEIAQTLKPSDTSLVTVGGREFYIWRYEGKLNGITNAVVLLSYPKNAFGQK